MGYIREGLRHICRKCGGTYIFEETSYICKVGLQVFPFFVSNKPENKLEDFSYEKIWNMRVLMSLPD
jgi:hypothetical protein